MSYIKNKHHDEIVSHGGARKGAGRPSQGIDGKIYSINVNNEHVELVESYKKRRQLSRLINRLLGEFISR